LYLSIQVAGNLYLAIQTNGYLYLAIKTTGYLYLTQQRTENFVVINTKIKLCEPVVFS